MAIFNIATPYNGLAETSAGTASSTASLDRTAAADSAAIFDFPLPGMGMT
ncbi:MAG: hypothetical protein AMXMBFR34_27200 [Myxococcaceae bacterium]